MIKVVGIEEMDVWNNIVKSFVDYDVYYLSGYAKAFQLNGDGDPMLIYIENGNTRAVNIVIKRDIQNTAPFETLEKNTYFDITTPYGYGGFLLEGEDVHSIKKEYLAFCHENKIISEFVRFHPVLGNYKKVTSLYDVTNIGKTIAIDTSSKDSIWNNLTSKNRNMIRKAQKNELQVFWGRDESLLKPFIKMYKETMDRDGASSYYYFPKEFYYSILNDLKENALWFYTKKGNEIISMAIFLFANKKMHYHLSASKSEYRHLAPSNLMIYEAANWASEQGIKKLHLGGGVGGSENDPLFKFKKAFNRYESCDFYIGKKIYDTELYQYLVDLRLESNENSNFFPRYRG